MVVLGIDTSCYTTSVALVDEKKQVLFEHRQLLRVPEGEGGLQQSMAVFQHINNLPAIIEGALKAVPPGRIRGVAAAVKPRPVTGSYMPVFVVASGHGRVLAASLGVPFWPTTHQEGHLKAGLWSAGWQPQGAFIAVHLSGGTSEVLVVTPRTGSFTIERVGGTTDLHAGQLVDRVGLKLGLPFPAGPHLERLARMVGPDDEPVNLPSAVRGYDFSFSGPASHAERLIRHGAPPAAVARAVERCIANTLEKVLRPLVEETSYRDILIVGGVAANKFLRERLRRRLEHRAVGAVLHFAAAEYSADNAVGVALLGLEGLA
ncbi:O-sialoglycoprotein endopeptidase [Thermanaeromonas sp. C210]|uniref:Kae1-like domain-containing protein n=1 Tax=Thermanaeromonas sp. C210 TaxID=2731925 RepID=UPI00155BE69A|nr:O-sialoglycoprotein endopeptidase [Thermanaeromonas sp. C210]GFN23321.1 O-sialoglycoprotein endopeptidase [Thermanaeromonas sp. C210]